ncbi:uncharacterized protein LOC128411581, partial [Podarcis raffonei]|uniref:uncharacterized protein LOC128411581 n=1 Tax=Podarcis raffonei TaxID=65483 RepID=UPI0023298361
CPEQFSYIDSWLSTLNKNPPWIRECKVQRCKLLAVKAEARKGILPNKLKPIFEGPEEEVLPPPPYAPHRREPNPNTPPVVTPRQESGTNNGGGVTELDSLIDYDKYLQEALESYNKAQAEVVIPPVSPSRTPSTVSFSGPTNCPPQTPVHPNPRELLQKLQEDLDRSASNTARRIKLLKERLGTDTIPYDLRPLEQSEEKGHVVAPLRRVFDALEEPVLVNGQPGPRPPRTSTLQYIPFTTTDLMNWKTHTPSFAEKPQAMMDLVTSIVNTHSPTWTDCRQLLNTLFTTEERRDIIEKAQIYLREQARVGNIFNIDRHLQDNFPLEDPNWDPNNAIHLARLTTYRQTLVQGIRRACQKPTNMSKVSEVEQKPNESPGDFLERLQEAYRIWTPFDPEAPENSRMITATFPDSIKLGFQEPTVTIQLGSHLIDFMIDTGAEYSVLPELLQKKASKSVVIKSATGQSAKRSFLQPLECQIGGHRLTHQFLYIPECPIPLLGRDMLSKLQAQITFTPQGPEMKLPSKAAGIITLSVPKEQSWRLMSALQVQPTLDTELNKLLQTLQVPPGVWAENSPPGMAKNIAPIVVTLKPMATPVSVKQYPLPRREAEGIQKHLDRLLKYGLLKPCQSEWNTPLLPVRKPGTDEYRPVQDLRLVNQAIETLHPNVPNPYTLLSLIPPEATFFTVLDLKDAFFCCRLAPQSQPIFAFQWEDPLTGTKGQLTWTRLPQGFKNSPTLFGTALAKDLTSYPSIPGEKVVLQYVDDLILAAKDFDTCKEGTEELLHLLWEAGYRVSQKKAQLCLEKVKYLGFDISHQQRALRPERKEAICLIKEPTTRKQLRGFLGTAGFCRLWIPDFSSLAKPLHESTRGAEKDPFVWGPEQQQAFLAIKQRLMEAPALGLPNSEKPFQLYVHEQNGIAAAVLTQRLGSWNRPVAYLSKQLDSVAKGWPPCLRAVAATASLVKEADKFTFGQTMYVNVPHAVLTLMEYKGSYWLTNPRMARYQGLLCENPRIHLRVVNMLNPATLLPLPEVDDEESHDCLQIMDEVYSSRPDLKDEPLKNPDVVYYTDGSSYLHEGARRAGYAVVTNEEVVEAEALPAGTSAQKAELIGLTRALQLAAGCKANIYTDSKYAFLTLHAHGALWKERGLIGAHGKALKYGPEVEILLEAVWAPEQIAVMHCKGHGRGRDPITRGNHAADKAAREAAQKPVGGFIAALIPEVVPEEVKPHYTPEERKWAEQEGAYEYVCNVCKLPNCDNQGLSSEDGQHPFEEEMDDHYDD